MEILATLAWYLAGVNIIAFILIGLDKRRAIKRDWRIPERTFWALALLGGAIGVLLAMYVYRHKTKHTSFKVGIPLLILVNGVSVYLLISLG